MRWLPFVLLMSACDMNLDFHSEATSITAIGDSSGTRVTICAGPSGLLSCNANEHFDVTLGSELVPATEGFLSFGVLEADFATNEAEAPISVVRTRDRAMASVDLPAPFDLGESPPAMRRGATFELAWQPTGDDPMSWSVALTCASGATYFGGDERVTDDGSVTISTSDFPDGEHGTCHAVVSLERSRDGFIDPAFPAKSTMVGRQARAVEFDLTQ